MGVRGFTYTLRLKLPYGHAEWSEEEASPTGTLRCVYGSTQGDHIPSALLRHWPYPFTASFNVLLALKPGVLVSGI